MSSGIQPALPDINTEWLIFGNAKNWHQTGTDILEQGYSISFI